MADQVSISIEGASKAVADMADAHGDILDEVERALNSSAAYSELMMKQYAPGSIPSWIDRDRVRRVGRDMVAEVGVQPATGSDLDPKWPLYVHEGTGIYNPRTGGPIRALPGRPMTFQKRGEPRKFKMWVRGQRPQKYVYMAYQMARVYVQARFSTLRFGRN